MEKTMVTTMISNIISLIATIVFVHESTNKLSTYPR